MLLKKLLAIFLLFLPLCAYMDEEEVQEVTFSSQAPAPWFTGPIVAPSSYTVKPGHVNLQPYFYFNVYSKAYDEHWHTHSKPNFYSANLQIITKIGLCQGLDFQIAPQVFYNETEGERYGNIGDLPLTLNIQLLKPQLSNPYPALKLFLKINAPTGKYQHLSSKLKKTDALGAGSLLPQVGLIIGKLIHTHGIHFLDLRFLLSYQVGTAVHVKGLNTYGGSKNTSGKIYPGNAFVFDAAFQYNVSRRWAFACDLYYNYNKKNRFSGTGGTPPKTQEVVSGPSVTEEGVSASFLPSQSISLAPAIEFNWSKNCGIIAGVWFSVAGKNTYQFTTGVISFNIAI